MADSELMNWRRHGRPSTGSGGVSYAADASSVSW
jgi:hypothetical protein